MNAVSFSLYHIGDSPTTVGGRNHANCGTHYLTGAVRNAELISQIYPGWKMVVFADPRVPRATLDQLQSLGAEVRMTEGCSMFHRFLINDDPKVERYLVRDADSRLNTREAKAVAEWIESGRSFHAIRDHPHHPQPIQGGLWGGVTGKVNIASLAQGINIRDRAYGADMRFLAQKLWPAIKADVFQHDLCTWRQYVGAKHFKAGFDDLRFAGEVFSSEDQPRNNDWLMRCNYLTA